MGRTPRSITSYLDCCGYCRQKGKLEALSWSSAALRRTYARIQHKASAAAHPGMVASTGNQNNSYRGTLWWRGCSSSLRSGRRGGGDVRTKRWRSRQSGLPQDSSAHMPEILLRYLGHRDLGVRVQPFAKNGTWSLDVARTTARGSKCTGARERDCRVPYGLAGPRTETTQCKAMCCYIPSDDPGTCHSVRGWQARAFGVAWQSRPDWTISIRWRS